MEKREREKVAVSVAEKPSGPSPVKYLGGIKPLTVLAQEEEKVLRLLHGYAVQAEFPLERARAEFEETKDFLTAIELSAFKRASRRKISNHTRRLEVKKKIVEKLSSR